MAFKTRRQSRYNFLRIHGFMRFESRELSKTPLRTPYFDFLIKERYQFFYNAIKNHWSLERYQAAIIKEYRDNGWVVKTRGGNIASRSAWGMFRANESVYRRKYPAYQSPWEKRQKDFRRSMVRVERSLRIHQAEWIAELDINIAKAHGARKAQLEKQRENLLTWQQEGL